MRTMDWPPRVENGRLDYVEGTDAVNILVMSIVSDLRQQPFNPDRLSIGDITFKIQSSARPMIDAALRRLAPVISIESIDEILDKEDGSARYIITYTDRESRSRGRVSVG